MERLAPPSRTAQGDRGLRPRRLRRPLRRADDVGHLLHRRRRRSTTRTRARASPARCRSSPSTAGAASSCGPSPSASSSSASSASPKPATAATPDPLPIRVFRASECFVRGPPARNTPMPRARTPGVRCHRTDIPLARHRPEESPCPTARRPRCEWLAAHHGVITTARPARATVSAAPRSIGLLDARRAARAPRRACSSIASSPDDARAALRRPVRRPTRRASSPARRPGMLAGLRRMPRSSALHFSVRHGVHLPIDGRRRCGARRPSSAPIDRRGARRHRAWRRGHGWRSTSPPTSTGSTTSRSSTSCSTSGR